MERAAAAMEQALAKYKEAEAMTRAALALVSPAPLHHGVVQGITRIDVTNELMLGYRG
jgi:hypothetical protein